MQTGVEPDVRAFLKKVLQTVTAIVVWAFICMFFGLYLQWAMIHDHFNGFNIIFYAWFLISFIGLIYFLVKIWKK